MMFVAVFVLMGLAQGRIYERCELARELKFVHRVLDHQLATWVCIAEHESQYNTSIVGHLNGDGSGDHGIFQISDEYWCSPPGKGLACGLNCADLEDDDISDDFACAQTIYKEHKRLSGDGFNAWAVYGPHCKGPKADRYVKDCFDGSEGPKAITTPAVVAAHGFFNAAAGKASKFSTRKPVYEPLVDFRSASVVQGKEFLPTKPQTNSFFASRSPVFQNGRFSASTASPDTDSFVTPTTTFGTGTTATAFKPVSSTTSDPVGTTAAGGLIVFDPTVTVPGRPSVFGFGQTFSSPPPTTLFTPTVVSPVHLRRDTVRPVFIVNGVKWY